MSKKDEQVPNKMGRKFTELNQEQLKALMRLRPTIEDTAAFFECSTDTIERYIRREYDLTYAVFRDQNMVHTRFMLIRTAIQKAEKGDNVMLIFCLKNLCGWKDKPIEEEENNFAKMSLQELIILAKAKLPELQAG